MERKVGIIGAGISGLLACKYALSKGYHPIVFESRSTIGGAWSKTLETTKLQTPKPLYQFSDFPWPSSVVTDFPDHTQVIDYLKSYANHFDLVKHIRFSTRVVSIKYEGASDEEVQSWTLWGGNGDPFGNTGKWAVTAQDLHNQSVGPVEGMYPSTDPASSSEPVIGYSESSANLYTSEIRCRWLFELLDGKFKLPNIIKMEKDIKEWDTSIKRYAGKYYRRSCIGALHICYNDQLCKDMGWKPKRKNGLWAELFEPYGPMDYA